MDGERRHSHDRNGKSRVNENIASSGKIRGGDNCAAERVAKLHIFVFLYNAQNVHAIK